MPQPIPGSVQGPGRAAAFAWSVDLDALNKLPTIAEPQSGRSMPKKGPGSTRLLVHQGCASLLKAAAGPSFPVCCDVSGAFDLLRLGDLLVAPNR